ncbi:hypothetical protein KSF_086290 [Reticulibacter mediterranei]|uniref:Uncharacterized protein n=1 Tax=Reticulibacter mediterranei TaxID=2778369 RepID=A0A8J3IYW6_9CHLR|nr:hypothetical protein KSF_086290 [Reticulibacter mediterranei]
MGHGGMFLLNGSTPPTEEKAEMCQNDQDGKRSRVIPEEQGTDALKGIHKWVSGRWF